MQTLLTHEVSVTCFKDGTPEELLEFFDQFNQVAARQALTTGQQKFSMAKSLLEGEALSCWNHILQQPNVMVQTDPAFEKAKKLLIAHVFPKKASACRSITCIAACVRSLMSEFISSTPEWWN